MGNVNWDKVETIVDEVLELPKEDWFEFIEQQCKASHAVKSEVTKLLQSITDSEGWLEDADAYKKNLIDTTFEQPPSSLVGTEVGSYLITEVIARGGMGTVYRGERTDGEFEHTVAIKVIKSGMVTPENLRLFNRERNILAGLNHPGIAKLFDGGVLENSSPYLVMEYIDGTPIDQYCDENKLTLNQRIKLFEKVLSAVEHAHENLIIHRDLKPDNILITKDGQVKILDFGIAKLLDTEDASMGENTTQTRILTPKYAAPEQIRQQTSTTATDLYSLGIILYQLLVGRNPYDLKNKSAYETENIVLKNAPVLPSSRLVQDRNSDGLSAKRSTTVRGVTKELEGDLDAILLKAIEKDPDKRYRTSNSLIKEFETYTSGLPVSARQRSAGYRLNKFVSRNKISLSVVATFILLIAGFTFFHTQQITKERNQAQLEAEKAEQVQNFLINLFEANNPELQQYSGKNMPAVALLDEGVAQVEYELTDQPVIQLAVLSSIYEAYENLEQYDSAEPILEQIYDLTLSTFGNNSTQYADVLAKLSTFNRINGNYGKGLELINQAIKIHKKNEGTVSINYANSLAKKGLVYAYRNNFDEAQKFYQQADSIYTSLQLSTQQHLGQINNMSNLAEVLVKEGEYEEAKKYHLQTIDQYKSIYDGSHIHIAKSYRKLGSVYLKQGDYESAIDYFNRALAIYDELLIADNLDAASAYNNMALAYLRIGKLEQAQQFSEKSYSIQKELLGPNHKTTLASLNTRAIVFKRGGDLNKARPLYEEMISQKKQKDPVNKTSLAVSQYNLADVLYEIGELQQSYTLFKKVLEVDKEHYGATHPTIALDLNKLGAVQRDLGLLDKAEYTFEEAGEIFNKKYPEDHLRVAEYLVEVGELELKKNNFEIASKHLKQALTVYQTNKLDKEDPKVERVHSLINTIQ